MDTNASSAPQSLPATVLHVLVADYFELFVRHRNLLNRPLSESIYQEFLRFQECGDAEAGYAGVACKNCGILASVPLSCNRRTWCPRCLVRRMLERADYITDGIVGDTPVRHFIPTYPPPVRYVLLHRPKLAAKVR